VFVCVCAMFSFQAYSSGERESEGDEVERGVGGREDQHDREEIARIQREQEEQKV